MGNTATDKTPGQGDLEKRTENHEERKTQTSSEQPWRPPRVEYFQWKKETSAHLNLHA